MNRLHLGKEKVRNYINVNQTGPKKYFPVQVDLAGANGMCKGSGFVEWKQTSADREPTGAWKDT